jgi:hypothetical protein
LMAEVENLLKEQQLTTAKPIEPASQKQEEEQNVGQNVGQDVEQKEEKIVVKSKYPDGTPDCVVSVLDSTEKKVKTPQQKIAAIVKLAKETPDVSVWAAMPGKVGSVPKELREYQEVKKGVREKLGIKPGKTPARPETPTPHVNQVAKNIEVGAAVVSAMTQPISAPVSAPIVQAPVVSSEDMSVIDSLTPGDKPILRLVNKDTGKVFLLWTDLKVASHKDFELRLRKYTAGDNSKLGNKVVPSVYLMKNNKVLLSLNAEQFIVFLNMVKQLTKSGKMDEIFQAFIALSNRS